LNQLIKDNTVYAKLFLTTLFWGSNYITGKVMSANLLPFTSSFLRFFIASLFLILFVLKKYGKLPPIDFSQFLLIIFLGLSGVTFFNFFFFQGLKYVSASRASIIISLNPSLITLISIFAFKEKMTLARFMGIILSLLGAVTVISDGNLPELFSKKIGYGELILIGGVICWAFYSVYGKVIMKKMKPIIAITYSCIAGTFFLMVPALLEGELNHFLQYGLALWSSVFIIGIFGTALSFTWYYEGIKKIGPARSGIFINFVPVFATLLAVLILREKVNASLVMGAILVICGVFLTNYQGRVSKAVAVS